MPVGNERLSKYAEKTHAYAKALRYTELNIRERLRKLESYVNDDSKQDAEYCKALIKFVINF